MSRPQCCRRIGQEPPCTVFKPAGIPARFLEEVVLTLDECEALRLADLNGLYHEAAAASMHVSRQTFGRIVDSARQKTAQALILGKALRIEGGTIEMSEARGFRCGDCQHTWEVPFGGGKPEECPHCGSGHFWRVHCGNQRKPGGPGEGWTARKRCCHRGGQSK